MWGLHAKFAIYISAFSSFISSAEGKRRSRTQAKRKQHALKAQKAPEAARPESQKDPEAARPESQKVPEAARPESQKAPEAARPESQKAPEAARPERAEAPSPGHRPGYNSNQQGALFYSN